MECVANDRPTATLPTATQRTCKFWPLESRKQTAATESLCISRDTVSINETVTPQRHTQTVFGHVVCDIVKTDTQTDMLLGEPKSAICVQIFDDSLNSAIHTTYRTWLRSSSMHEPRDPPLKVVFSLLSSAHIAMRTFRLYNKCVGKNNERGRCDATSGQYPEGIETAHDITSFKGTLPTPLQDMVRFTVQNFDSFV